MSGLSPTARPLPLLVAMYLGALALMLLAVGPAIWLVGVALSPPSVPLSRLPGPSEMTLGNFEGAWNEAQLGRALANSVIVTAAQTLLNVLLAAMAAYPLARMRFRGRGLVFVLVLATIMVPEQVILVPLFRTVVGLGLYDTLAAVVLPFSVTAFGIYLCRQAFLALPMELEEAATLDGAGPWRTWWSVMLPLTAPTLATLAVFSVIGAWSNLLWPLVVLQSRDTFTLPVALNQLLGVFATNQRFAYAGAVLAVLPVVAFYALASRWLKGGMLGGAVKG
ncbi:carbohydrate ABC transporter permease [Phycisphaera mikurensis]|uniref:Putative ABC transporter permease protein n=1 Tax=Phycisphaera mikurensis (strain NBRC 102666 / KCTC 22515 / FYK2301M01) TaxID=1142394 RepID=I0IDX3_PHYMF|nr:carbohydrate ABC transporter permease [Phycisphaera mikurensis]MBB6441268.1 putative chitobiose transport system permease protein [Phycisphaera mikurensis]BAM03461.1 putative ABC transporter permease protein [Phycisphaera mikurensis NBRC 102666]